MSAENEAMVRRYVEEVYDQRELEVADELFASDFTLHDPDLPGGARGPEWIKNIVRTFVDAFPDLGSATLNRGQAAHSISNSHRGLRPRHLGNSAGATGKANNSSIVQR
jgi:hypothetical protein